MIRKKYVLMRYCKVVHQLRAEGFSGLFLTRLGRVLQPTAAARFCSRRYLPFGYYVLARKREDA